MACVFMGLCAPCACRSAQRLEDGVKSSETGVLGSCEPLGEGRKPNPGPL